MAGAVIVDVIIDVIVIDGGQGCGQGLGLVLVLVLVLGQGQGQGQGYRMRVNKVRVCHDDRIRSYGYLPTLSRTTYRSSRYRLLHAAHQRRTVPSDQHKLLVSVIPEIPTTISSTSIERYY